MKIFFLRQLLSARNQKAETKVDVVWIIIISIFIIIYYSYVIICSLPSVNAYKKIAPLGAKHNLCCFVGT